MGKPEAVVEDYLRIESQKRGYLCYKFVSPSQDGVPDRIIMGKGIIFFVETKAPGEKTRKLQRSVIRTMMSFDAIVYVANSKEKVDMLLDEMDSVAEKAKDLIPELKNYIQNLPAMQATVLEVNT
jgi:hypothetical protein